MKIGTVTFWYSKENYGAMLQCFALIKYLIKQGHDAKLLRIMAETGKDLKHPMLFKMANLFYALVHPQSFFRKLKNKILSSKTPNIVVERGFNEFLLKNIPTYPKIYCFDEIDHNPVDADALICGSDQIWGGVSRTYFLQMKGDYKRISYAASFGGTKYENPFARNLVSKWLKEFDFITVREEEGLDFCRKLGVKAELAPDPTMLLEREDYLELTKSIPCQGAEPYIFLYLLGKDITVDVADIFEFANKNKITIQYVASQGRYDEFEKIYPTVEEWIALIRDAKYVVTNSFHGTVFALIFGKPFLTFPIIGKSANMNSRIETLLGKYKMKDRIFTGNLSMLLQPMEFDYFTQKKEEEKH